MGASGVRLRYSGFILFFSRLLSVGTGLFFTLMITRNVSGKEFGILGNISDVMSYFALLAGIFPFWATRFVARKHPGSSVTGLVANLLISLPCVLIYLAALPTIMATFQISSTYWIVYAVVALEILEIYSLNALEAILQAKRPQAKGFGFLIFELCKVLLGFMLLMQLRLGLLGAITSIILAYLFQIAYYLRLTYAELREKVRWNYVREWLKASPLNLYGMAGQRIAALYLIFLFVYGGTLSRAYYAAATTIATIIGYSSLLSYALYPRLLSEDRSEDVFISLKTVLMFATPMTVGAVILADSYLTVLNPIYSVARLVLILLVIDYLCRSISSVFNTVVRGTEKLDAQAKISYKSIIKSRLFILLSLPYVQAAVVLPATYFILNLTAKGAVESATSVALMVAVTDVAMTFVRYGLAKKSLNFSMPWIHLCKYLGASAVMGLTLYLFPAPTRLSVTLAETLLGSVIYLVVLSAIDKESRLTIRSVKNELLKMLRTPSEKT